MDIDELEIPTYSVQYCMRADTMNEISAYYSMVRTRQHSSFLARFSCNVLYLSLALLLQDESIYLLGLELTRLLLIFSLRSAFGSNDTLKLGLTDQGPTDSTESLDQSLPA